MAIIIGSPYQMNTHYQYPLPGKLVCVLIKLAAIREFRIEFLKLDQYDFQTMTSVSKQTIVGFQCNVCGYFKRLARNLFLRPVRLTVRVNLRGIILVRFPP